MLWKSDLITYRLRLFANVNLMQKCDLLRTLKHFWHRKAVKTEETSGGPSGCGFGKFFRTEQRLLWKGNNWSPKESVDSVSVLLNYKRVIKGEKCFEVKLSGQMLAMFILEMQYPIKTTLGKGI